MVNSLKITETPEVSNLYILYNSMCNIIITINNHKISRFKYVKFNGKIMLGNYILLYENI